jgi:hypothetical protein
MPPLHGLYCCITYPDGMGYNTMASSVFDAAAKALEWVEVDCQTFGTPRSEAAFIYQPHPLDPALSERQFRARSLTDPGLVAFLNRPAWPPAKSQ